jgi:hypothetical protein
VLADRTESCRDHSLSNGVASHACERIYGDIKLRPTDYVTRDTTRVSCRGQVFLVVADLSRDMLLGTNYCRTAGAVIDMRDPQPSIIFHRYCVTVPVLSSQQSLKGSLLPKSTLYAVEVTVIPPFSERFIKVRYCSSDPLSMVSRCALVVERDKMARNALRVVSRVLTFCLKRRRSLLPTIHNPILVDYLADVWPVNRLTACHGVENRTVYHIDLAFSPLERTVNLQTSATLVEVCGTSKHEWHEQ